MPDTDADAHPDCDGGAHALADRVGPADQPIAYADLDPDAGRPGTDWTGSPIDADVSATGG